MQFLPSTRARILGLAGLLAMVAGCGGGGGGSDPPAPAPPPVNSRVFPAAAVVIGQASFDSADEPGAEERPEQLLFPSGSPGITAEGRLFVATSSFGKVFDHALTTPEPAPFTFSHYLSASVNGGKLVLTRSASDEIGIQIYNHPPASSQDVVAPSVTGGSGRVGTGEEVSSCVADGLFRPNSALITPQGRLLVADTGNNRVLIWDSVPDSGELGPANIVLGQHNMETCAANDDDHNDLEDLRPAARTLNRPVSVWSDDQRVIVADMGNNRLLVWDTFPATFQEASRVIGQPSFTASEPNAGQPGPGASTLCDPASVDVSRTGRLAVVDSCNHRVLMWGSVADAGEREPDGILGQPDFVDGRERPPSAKTLRFPFGLRFHGSDLIVTDTNNHRVLIWKAID